MFSGFIGNLVSGLAAALVTFILCTGFVIQEHWETYTEEDKMIASRTILCLMIVAFLIPFAFS